MRATAGRSNAREGGPATPALRHAPSRPSRRTPSPCSSRCPPGCSSSSSSPSSRRRARCAASSAARLPRCRRSAQHEGRARCREMPRDAASSCWVGDLGGYISAGPASAWAMAVRRGENSWGTPHKQTSAWVWVCVVWWERFSVRNYVWHTPPAVSNVSCAPRIPDTRPHRSLQLSDSISWACSAIVYLLFCLICLWTLLSRKSFTVYGVTPFMCAGAWCPVARYSIRL